jgi:hypothetical protein
LKEVELICVGSPALSYCDVLRKDDLDGAIRGWMTRQYDPQRRLSVFLCHQEVHASAVADEDVPMSVGIRVPDVDAG